MVTTPFGGYVMLKKTKGFSFVVCLMYR